MEGEGRQEEEREDEAIKDPSRAYVRFLLFACLTILLAVANPFGMREASDAESQAMAMRLLAPWVSAAGRDDIVVVEISDDDLRHWQSNWPLRYNQIGQLFYTLGTAGAAAVFYDGVFTQQRASVEAVGSLADFLKMGQMVGTPIYLAGYPGRAYKPALSEDAVAYKDGILAPLADASAHVAAISWSEKGENYPLLVEGADGAPHPTPALLLYRDYCARPETDCKEGIAEALEGGTLPDVVRTWPSRLPPTAPWQRLHDSCQPVGQAGWERFSYSMKSIASAVFAPSGGGPARQPCPPYTILSGRDVWMPVGAEGATMVAQKLPFLEGKLVLVGTRMNGLPDWEESPVHGTVTGVMSHAVALGNLIDFDAAYLREAPDAFFGLGMDDLVELGLLLLIVGRISLFQANKSSSGGKMAGPRAMWFRGLGLMGGISFIVGIFGWEQPLTVWSPAFVLSVAGVGALATAFWIAPYEMWGPPPAEEGPVRFKRLYLLFISDLAPFLVAAPLLLSVTLLMSVVLRFAPMNWLGILGLLLFVASYVLSDFFEEIVDRIAGGWNATVKRRKAGIN